MVGQRKLIDKLNTLNLDTLPKALILVGPSGCGKHTYLTEITKKLNLETEDISNSIDDEKVLEIQQNVSPKLYYIDSSIIRDKDQNIILKLLEEPSAFSYICILCTGIKGLLPTILNRCFTWIFEPYTIEELAQFSNLSQAELSTVIKVLDTPGKLLATKSNITEHFNTADQIFKFIDKALISNVLILPEKVSYLLTDTSKLFFDTFVQILNICAVQLFIKHEISLQAVVLTSNLLNDINIFNIDKKKLYEKYLIDLKDELKRYKGQN